MTTSALPKRGNASRWANNIKPKRDANGRFTSSSRNKPPIGMSAQKIAQKASGKKNRPIPKKPPTRNNSINHVGLVVDCSGSMKAIWSTVLQELKNNFNTIRGESIRTGQDSTLTFTVFGDHVHTLFSGKPIQDAKVPETILPNMGYTSLFDAVNSTIDTLNKLPHADEASMVVIVLTDGEENNSRTTASTLRSKIQAKQKTDRWSFAFCVPPGSKNKIMNGLGLPDGNVVEWENTVSGTRFAGQSITRGVSSYYNMRASGGTSTQGFFTSNADKITPTQVQKALDDITKQVKIWEVPREITIRDFVESKVGQYTLGSAFYQLSKNELIESDKELLLMERGKKVVWAGPQVRDMLKLPSNQDVKVRPGNFGRWIVFVLSKSVNRKLVRGTKLIVRV